MVFKPQTFHELPPQAEMNNPTEAIIESDVAEALSRAGSVDAGRVSVTARNGDVTLTGFVSSGAEVETATEVAEMVKGVTGVDNRLAVQHGTT